MTEQNYEQMRSAMVASQLRPTGVDDPGVVDAMGAVPRERFVPAERAGTAYIDASIPLGGGRSLNSPMTTGRLLSAGRPRKSDRVLLIGAATGYTAAVLKLLARSVVAVESDPELAAAARSMGVDIVEAALAEGTAEGAPFDLVIIDGAVPQVPQAIVDLLADGGRLATAIVAGGVTRLALGRKSGDAFGLLPFADAGAVVLPGFDSPRGFSF